MSLAFRERYSGGACLPLFNRFSYGRFYRTLLRVCRRAEVPYLVDIDDLFWELPQYSADTAQVDTVYRQFLEELCQGAAIIIASTPFLQARLQERYPHVVVCLVENCSPAWFAPHGAAVIANTDAVKLGVGELGWFAPLLEGVWGQGIALQLLGDNAALSDGELGLKTHSLPRTSYFEYQQRLHWQGFRVGLVPVESSPYADAKSAIKILEFINHGIPVIASDTEPHRSIVAQYPQIPVTLVPNTTEGWSTALATVVQRAAEAELAQGVAVNQCLYQTRRRQLEQWEDVFQRLPRLADIARRNNAVLRLFRAHGMFERVKRVRRMLPV